MSKIVYKKRPNPIAKQLRDPRYKPRVTRDRTKYARKDSEKQKTLAIDEFRSVFRKWK